MKYLEPEISVEKLKSVDIITSSYEDSTTAPIRTLYTDEYGAWTPRY